MTTDQKAADLALCQTLAAAFPRDVLLRFIRLSDLSEKVANRAVEQFQEMAEGWPMRTANRRGLEFGCGECRIRAELPEDDMPLEIEVHYAGKCLWIELKGQSVYSGVARHGFDGEGMTEAELEELLARSV